MVHILSDRVIKTVLKNNHHDDNNYYTYNNDKNYHNYCSRYFIYRIYQIRKRRFDITLSLYELKLYYMSAFSLFPKKELAVGVCYTNGLTNIKNDLYSPKGHTYNIVKAWNSMTMGWLVLAFWKTSNEDRFCSGMTIKNFNQIMRRKNETYNGSQFWFLFEKILDCLVQILLFNKNLLPLINQYYNGSISWDLWRYNLLSR